jgi:hypothetical protein
MRGLESSQSPFGSSKPTGWLIIFSTASDTKSVIIGIGVIHSQGQIVIDYRAEVVVDVIANFSSVRVYCRISSEYSIAPGYINFYRIPYIYSRLFLFLFRYTN